MNFTWKSIYICGVKDCYCPSIPPHLKIMYFHTFIYYPIFWLHTILQNKFERSKRFINYLNFVRLRKTIYFMYKVIHVTTAVYISLFRQIFNSIFLYSPFYSCINLHWAYVKILIHWGTYFCDCDLPFSNIVRPMKYISFYVAINKEKFSQYKFWGI